MKVKTLSVETMDNGTIRPRTLRVWRIHDPERNKNIWYATRSDGYPATVYNNGDRYWLPNGFDGKQRFRRGTENV